ncbi:MAG: hypothetical protein QOJ66_1947 [Ilumatobacteraceae bacterium]
MRFLLVHGTTQSPDGWRLLIDELGAFGHSAVTTDLARFGERKSAIEYGKAVGAELSGPKVDVVVAHSGAGLVLPAIATATDATMQVYLAAFVPNGSRSLMDRAERRSRSHLQCRLDRCRSHEQPRRCSLAPAIPAISIVPDSDRTARTDWMIDASRQRLGIEPTIVPGGHCPHVSRPREIATILAMSNKLLR